MNILTQCEMEARERQLLRIKLPGREQLKLPPADVLRQLSVMQSEEMKQDSFNKNAFLNQRLQVTNYLRVEELKDPNAAIRMVIFNVLAIIFTRPTKIETGIRSESNGRKLLKDLKCLLYSRDILLRDIKDTGIQISDESSKGLLAQFFTQIQRYGDVCSDRELVLKYCAWILSNNRFLQKILISALRYILNELQIEGAYNYTLAVDEREAIINLIETFELSFRYIDDIVFFDEEKIFLTFCGDVVMLGSFQEREKQEKLGVQWPVSALTISLNGTGDLSEFHALKKRKAVIENDVQMFNCLLRSSRSHRRQASIVNRDQKQASDAQENEDYEVVRKKKDEIDIQRQNAIKMQFAKLILGESGEMPEEELQEIKGTGSSKTSEKEGIKELHHLHHQANGLFKMKGQSLLENNEKRNAFIRASQGSQPFKMHSNGSKNCISVKSKTDHPSATLAFKSKNQILGNARNKKQSDLPLFSDSSESKMVEHRENIHPYQGTCPCFRQKLKRNTVISQVVCFNFTPVVAPRVQNIRPQFRLKSPTVQNKVPKIVVTSPQKYKEFCFREERVPTFIKTRIERVDDVSRERRIPNISNDKIKRMFEQRPNHRQGGNSFKHLSQIIDNRSNQRSYSPNKKNYRSKTKKMDDSPTFKNYDLSQVNPRPGQGYTTFQREVQNNRGNDQFGAKTPYRKTLPQFQMTSNLRGLISPSKAHSFFTNGVNGNWVNNEQGDSPYGQRNLTGFRGLISNKSEKVLNYCPVYYL